MDNVLNQLLTYVVAYGYPALAVTSFVSSAGAPLPSTAVLLVSGALAAAGSLNLFALVLLATACSTGGDILDYYAGKSFGVAVLQGLGNRSPAAQQTTAKAQHYFRRWSGIAVFLSRWLFTPFGSVVNVAAGVAGYPIKRFLLFDVLGEAMASVLFVGLGYVFGANWPYIWQYLDGLPGILVGVSLGLGLIVIGARKAGFLR